MSQNLYSTHTNLRPQIQQIKRDPEQDVPEILQTIKQSTLRNLLFFLLISLAYSIGSTFYIVFLVSYCK
ncbi:unnamed protein product, partial [Mesorhabditis belari]|uniref:Uncharacterized protein n=1 Tax=Mesorhabditis belari TaxID=2138241 RepID=A0AAF3F2L5_9BILA